MEIELKNITNESYDLTGKYLHFITEDGKNYKLTKEECLKLVYTLYDSLDLPYEEPDKLSEILEAEELGIPLNELYQ